MTQATIQLDDSRILGYDPLVSPALLKHDFPVSEAAQETVRLAREQGAAVVDRILNKVLVIVGPCSIHNPEEALEYARRLREQMDRLPGLVIIMRAYLNLERPSVGSDPDLDNSYKINKGLRIARQLLIDILSLNVAVGCELLDTISPQYIADLVSWGAIGARTTESQLHRELASGVSFPIGFKNGTDGSVSVAVDAMRSSSAPHAFLGINSQGLAAIVRTSGNKDVHVILRGGTSGPNYATEHVQKAAAFMSKARPDVKASVMIDASHGNSSKDYKRQPVVVADICQQLRNGDDSITGVMFESNLNEGRQDIPKNGQPAYGISVTDACVNWETTVDMLNQLNEASLARAALTQSKTKTVA
ncbi:3-deoxy-7-phosphoheptulonate synthase [Phaffia rhodozyma]|uniref:Phospho-2-dehydro-3-deoxyheptonate aldolase n=1 Tax=Phaffia rhodozyma TaxID=264483 RepID=A0A0F7SXN0_PHARH|nr:3-deoxy-7-phosphoheptulonate synthase [Phaffia rhodozyma]